MAAYNSENVIFNIIIAGDNFMPAFKMEVKMEVMIGRVEGAKISSDALKLDSPELIVVLGRRRVEKTFLVRSVYKKQQVFELSGSDNANMGEQLLNFSKVLGSVMWLPAPIVTPKNCTEAFSVLQETP